MKVERITKQTTEYSYDVEGRVITMVVTTVATEEEV